MHRGWLAGLVGALAVLAACGDDGTAAPDTTAAEVTTTTVPDETTTTTTIEDESPPELLNTGDDFVAIYESLAEYASWLDEHPTLDALDELYHQGSPAFATGERVTRTLVENGWHWSGPTARIDEVSFGDPIDERSVTVIVVSRDVPAMLLDVDGNPVASQPPLPGDARLLIQLARGDDGRWRIAQNELLESL